MATHHWVDAPVIDLEDDDLLSVGKSPVANSWKVPLQAFHCPAIDLTQQEALLEPPKAAHPSQKARRRFLVRIRQATKALQSPQAAQAPGQVHQRLREGLLGATMQRLQFRAVVARRGKTRGRKACCLPCHHCVGRTFHGVTGVAEGDAAAAKCCRDSW